MSSTKSGLKSLYSSKLGKLIPVFIIAGLVATASAAVFVNYYAAGTATVGTNDVVLAAGTDSSTCTTNFPCIQVTPSSLGDYATVAMNLGSDTAQTPQPQSFFTDAMTVTNSGPNSRTINSITISGISSTSASDFGSITVYYCATQTNTPSTGCTGSFTFSSTTGGSVTNLPVSLGSGATQYIEFSGYAGASATAGDSISFNVQIQWA